MNGWKFLLVTFGCKVNQYETQSVREAWTRLGGTECEKSAEADVILVKGDMSKSVDPITNADNVKLVVQDGKIVKNIL